MADKSLGKKSDTRLAKGLIKGLQGIDNKDANEMKALMNELLKGGIKPVNKAMGGKVKNNKKTTLVDATIAANPIKNMPMLIKELLSSKIGSQFGKKDGGSVKKMKYGGDPTGNTMSEADMQRVRELMGRTKTKETGNAISDADLKKIKALLAGAGGAGIGKGMPKMKFGGKVQKMKDGGKAVPVAKVKIERLKKMRDPYGESNFAHQISDGKDAYTQRVIAAMKESGQPFMYGGKVKKMRNGGSVNTTKSIQLNPKTGEPI